MSLVRCPKCGHAASDDSIRCNFCGQVLKPEIVEAEEAEKRAKARAEAEAERARKAEEQKISVIPEEEAAPEQVASEETANAGRTGRSKKKKGKGLKLFIILLILALIACAGYWFLQNRDSAELEETITEEPAELEEEVTDGGSSEDGGLTEDDGVIVDNGEEQPADGEEFYDPAEDGGTDDNGAQGGQDVTDDDPFADED